MECKAIDHIGILVADLEQGIKRWGDATGYRFSPITRYKTDRYVDRTNPAPHHHETRTSMSWQGPPYIELLEVSGTGTHGPDQLGVHHIGFVQDGQEEACAVLRELAAMGIPDDGRSLDTEGLPLLWFTAPEALDGIRLEIIAPVGQPVVDERGRRIAVDESGRPRIWEIETEH